MIYCEVFSLLIHNCSLVTNMIAKVTFFSCPCFHPLALLISPVLFVLYFIFMLIWNSTDQTHVLTLYSTYSCDFRDLCFLNSS